MQICLLKALLYYLRVYWIFDPFFPHFSYNLSEIRYKRSTIDAFKDSRVLRISAQERPYFSYGRKWICIYACIVKPYDILIVKNAVVKSVFYLTEYDICLLVTGESVFFLWNFINLAKDTKFVFTFTLYY